MKNNQTLTDAATPRPWKRASNPLVINGKNGKASESFKIECNCKLFGLNCKCDRKLQANAALIVRSVNLLEAHEAVAEAAAKCMECAGEVLGDRVRLNQALANLAKLKESQPK